MKSDFALAIAQIAAEKDLPKDVILAAVETALASAYRKEDLVASQSISIKINPSTFEVKAFTTKKVTDQPTEGQDEITLEEARRLKKDVEVGDTIDIETVLPKNAGRIAAQTAKQVIMQRLHEAENEAIFEEFVGKEGDVVNGLVRRIEGSRVFVDLGRTEAILPPTEQIKGERYRVGQRTKVYLLQIARLGKATEITVSRTHRNLVWRLFELGVPEIRNGMVELKSIAREAGYRTKIAVAARQPGIDPVGTCVGQRGIRIQNIVNELEGEKIDVIQWNADPTAFIANALSPAQILSVTLSESEGAATVVVPDRQLSLAIGKEGQNARLAAKLTGWRIDIKSASMAEAEIKAKQKEKEAIELSALEEAEAIADAQAAEATVAQPTDAALVTETEGAEPEQTEPRLIRLEPSPQEEEEKIEEEPQLEAVIPQIFLPPQYEEASRELRFAEDLVPTKNKAERKSKKIRDEEGAPRGKPKKSKRSKDYEEQEEEEYQ